MKDLIKALTIAHKYIEPGSYHNKFPTHCEHDVLYVCGLDWNKVTRGDKVRLGKLGFHWDKDEEHLYSFEYGSC